MTEQGKIYIGQLSEGTTETMMKEYFGNFGTVKEVSIKTDFATGKPIFGFVTFDSNDCVATVKEFGDHLINEKVVTVKDAIVQDKGGKGKGKGEHPSDPKKVFVGGLPPTTTVDEIKAAFTAHGEISQVELKMRPDQPGQNRGFCFISFAEESGATAAIANYKENKIGEKWVEVKKVGSNSEPQTGDPKMVFAGGLPQDVSETMCKEYFGNFGTVTAVSLKMHPETQKPRGFCFITFEDAEMAKVCLDFTDHKMGESKIDVKQMMQMPKGGKAGKGKGKGMMMPPWMMGGWGMGGGWGADWGSWGNDWGSWGGKGKGKGKARSAPY